MMQKCLLLNFFFFTNSWRFYHQTKAKWFVIQFPICFIVFYPVSLGENWCVSSPSYLTSLEENWCVSSAGHLTADLMMLSAGRLTGDFMSAGHLTWDFMSVGHLTWDFMSAGHLASFRQVWRRLHDVVSRTFDMRLHNFWEVMSKHCAVLSPGYLGLRGMREMTSSTSTGSTWCEQDCWRWSSTHRTPGHGDRWISDLRGFSVHYAVLNILWDPAARTDNKEGLCFWQIAKGLGAESLLF